MKEISFLKGKHLLTLFLFLVVNFSALGSVHILNNDVQLNEKTVQKISQIGAELYSKTNINAYIYAKDGFGINSDLPMSDKIRSIRFIEDNITKTLNGSYVVLLISLDDIHVNILMSDDLKPVIDKDEILNDYVVPLLASKDKNSLNSKVSAAALNGYAEITDRIAASKNLTLTSSIGSGGTQASSIWKVFMYTLIVGGLLAYTYAILRSKKYG